MISVMAVTITSALTLASTKATAKSVEFAQGDIGFQCSFLSTTVRALKVERFLLYFWKAIDQNHPVWYWPPYRCRENER